MREVLSNPPRHMKVFWHKYTLYKRNNLLYLKYLKEKFYSQELRRAFSIIFHEPF